MSRDIQTKKGKSAYLAPSKKKEEAARLRKKQVESSDSDSGSNNDRGSDSDNDSESGSDNDRGRDSNSGSSQSENEEEEEINMQEYREFLAKTFPSKHLDKKVKAGKELKDVLKKDLNKKDLNKKDLDKKDLNKKVIKKKRIIEEDDDDDSDEDYIPKKSTKKGKVVPAKSKKISESESESESEDLEKESKVKSKTSKFNIIFTIGSGNKEFDDSEFDESEDWATCSDEDEETENEDDPVSTDESDDEEEEEEEEEEVKPITRKKVTKKETSDINSPDINSAINSDKENIITILKGLQSKSTDTALIDECIKVCEEKIKLSRLKQEKKIKKEKARNERIFKRILRDKNTMNDFDFFEKLEQFQQKKIIKELKEINKITRVEKPYRLTLLEAEIPLIFKSAALKKISTLRHMEPGSGEFYKIKNWVDTFMRIPFGKYEHLPISIDDGVEKCHEFMASAQKTLDEAVYGLNDAKMQIMQLLGQLITNPKAIGTAVAIHGPPGSGKTSLVREGISKILNRPFAFIALGGATDSSFLEGHGYTYEGSMWGKIVQILIDSKCMNPVIYFDELDKISETPKGEEIAGILTHLTDTSQNSQFHDKYFAEIDFDLSKCLFIFSYNDESKVNPILKDRMYRIQTKGYNQKQKTIIANNYLLPKIREQVRFKVDDIIIPDETEHYIIDNFCNKEDGVRNLKRCLEIIYTKLNLYRLMRPGSNLFEEDMALKVEFPFKVTKDIVDKLIKTNNSGNSALHSLYV